jgi:hypothetical protein
MHVYIEMDPVERIGEKGENSIHWKMIICLVLWRRSFFPLLDSKGGEADAHDSDRAYQKGTTADRRVRRWSCVGRRTSGAGGVLTTAIGQWLFHRQGELLVMGGL